MESFESKLHRIGYKLNNSDSSELVIRVTRTKIVTAFLLTLIGILLMSRIFGPLEYVMAEIRGTEFEGSGIVTSINVALGIFGALCFYRGFYRFIEFRGFQVKVSNALVIVKRSEEIKLKQFEILNPTELSCDLSGEDIIVSCLDQNSNRSQILRETNEDSDSLPVLQALTIEIEKRIKG